ncbi:uncharacterized protein LOC144911026 [Branchiostoma floridae x Branchiostoma belcheri]
MRYLLLVVITLLCVALVTATTSRRTPPTRILPRRSVRMRTSVPTHAPHPHPQTRQPLHGHHPTCQDLPSGTYPDLEDCTKFYMCSNGISSSFSCPDGLLFDIKTLRCEWPEEATCATSVKEKKRTPAPLPTKKIYSSAISYDTVTIKTSPTHDSQSGDRLTVEIFSDVCDDVCATTAIDGLAQAGTEYKHSFGASDFGDPTMISLTTSGDDQLILDWVEVYNGETKKFYHFSCPSNGCRLSTDPKEGDQQVILDVDAHHTLTLRTSATRDSKSSDSLTVSIYSDVCDNVCKTMVFSGHTEDGTEYEHPFPAPDFGDPTVIRLQISGNDELILDWVEVFNVYTGKYYRFPCPSNGCHLSKDNAEANWQMFLHVDV